MMSRNAQAVACWLEYVRAKMLFEGLRGMIVASRPLECDLRVTTHIYVPHVPLRIAYKSMQQSHGDDMSILQ